MSGGPDNEAHVRAICERFPSVVEEQAWVGVRWRVRGRTFAHVLTIDEGWPPAYSTAAGTAGPAVVLMFRATGDDLDALRNGGPPFFATPWRHDEIGLLLTDHADWREITELLTDSYCVQAPRALAAQVRAAG